MSKQVTTKLALSAVVLVAVTVVLLSSVPSTATGQSDSSVARFWGNAYIDNELAPEGTLIEALSAGTVVASTTVRVLVPEVNYILNVPPPSPVATLTFRVGGYEAMETAVWEQGVDTFPFDITAISSAIPGSALTTTPGPTLTFVTQSETEGIVVIQGPAGPQGVTGERGPEGAPGPTGKAGVQGPQGEKGPQGEIGPTGKPASQLLIIIALAMSGMALGVIILTGFIYWYRQIR